MIGPTAVAQRTGTGSLSARTGGLLLGVASLLEAVGPPKAVEPIVVFDATAWLKPLADMISLRDRGVAVTDSTTPRLFRGGPTALTEFVTLGQATEHQRRQLDSHVVVTPVIHGAERSQERAALTMLEDAITADWTVAAGLDRGRGGPGGGPGRPDAERASGPGVAALPI